MSVVLLACLFFYGTMRSALWMRGQIRYRRLSGEFPRVSAPPEPPAHLGDSLGRLLACSYNGRVRLTDSVRSIATVLIVDPDVPLGVVRDFRFRTALADAWSAAREWQRHWETLNEAEQRRLEQLGYTPRTFCERCADLRGAVRRYVRAPALEPFPVADVEASKALVLALVRDLEGFERALAAAPSAGPYRA